MERLLDPSAVRDHVVPNTTELNEEALMLLTAGNDTTANAMIFGVYYICRHLDVQQELVAELRAQFPGTEQKITYEELRNLPYLVREPPPSKTTHNPSSRTSPPLYLKPDHAHRDLSCLDRNDQRDPPLLPSASRPPTPRRASRRLSTV